MNEVFYLVSSFWLGALHAATPGHGKTIAAAYIVGARGRPVDALVLGIFVTLSHTSGIVLVAVLATFGSAWFLPQRVEAFVAVLFPDPGALAILLAALASGKVMLGLFTVLVFSLGFASVLVVVGIAAAVAGDLVLGWLDTRWVGRLQVAAAAVIILVGVVLT